MSPLCSQCAVAVAVHSATSAACVRQSRREEGKHSAKLRQRAAAFSGVHQPWVSSSAPRSPTTFTIFSLWNPILSGSFTTIITIYFSPTLLYLFSAVNFSFMSFSHFIFTYLSSQWPSPTHVAFYNFWLLGISRNHYHKRRATGGKRAPLRKKRKFELGRPSANTKVSSLDFAHGDSFFNAWCFHACHL